LSVLWNIGSSEGPASYDNRRPARCRASESVPVLTRTRPQGGQVYYTDAAAGHRNDRERSSPLYVDNRSCPSGPLLVSQTLFSRILRLIAENKPPLANAAVLRNDVDKLFVCMFVCLSLCRWTANIKCGFLKKQSNLELRSPLTTNSKSHITWAFDKPILDHLGWPWETAQTSPRDRQKTLHPAPQQTTRPWKLSYSGGGLLVGQPTRSADKRAKTLLSGSRSHIVRSTTSKPFLSLS